MNFFKMIKDSWLAQLSTMMGATWFLFLLIGLIDGDYWDVSALSIGLIALSSIACLVGGVIVLKLFAKNRTTVPAAHWMDVFVNRILITLLACIAIGAMSGLLLATGSMAGSMAAYCFVVICGLFLVVGLLLSHIYIKQAIVTEGTLKALELYNGKNRSKSYGAK